MTTHRARAMRALANRMDMEYQPEDNLGLMTHLQDFRLFQAGHRRAITNVLRRQHELMESDLFIFDYEYQSWTGSSNGNRHHQTAFFLRSQQLSLPEMRLQPETLMHKIGELVGFHDIDFVRFPKFSGQYRLTGPDEDYIRHHFTDEVLNYFTLNKGWTVEGLGYFLLVYRKNLLLPIDQVGKFYYAGQKIFDLLTDQTT